MVNVNFDDYKIKHLLQSSKVDTPCVDYHFEATARLITLLPPCYIMATASLVHTKAWSSETSLH